jgi:ABC-2 type transport system ATP-binding protein
MATSPCAEPPMLRPEWLALFLKGYGMTTPQRSAIRATGLSKAFGDKVVLNGIDLDIAEGSVYALLGPNGAGKTTAVQILSTYLRPDAGTIMVAGHDIAREPDAVRALIGVTGQFSAVDSMLSGAENLRLMAALHHLSRAEGRRRVDALVAQFELAEVLAKPAMTYSGGMRRRLDLAMTLIGNPRVIFLDEPTIGLDPRSRHGLWQAIRELVAGGVTILLTTQYLDEADQLADRIGVLNSGRIVAEGTPAELKRKVPGGHVTLQFADAAGLDAAAELFAGSGRNREALTLQVPSDGGVRSLRSLLDRLDGAAIEVGSLAVHTPDLDDVFFALTGDRKPQKEASP